jgi:glycosyltransferase involved in cell wall biosynthesis
MSFYNRYWDQQLTKVLREHGGDLLHVHDLPMLGTALAVGRRFNIPVIADLHENYPAALKYSQTTHLKLYQRITHWIEAHLPWGYYEKCWASAANKVLVVAEEAKTRLVKAGVSQENIEVIENTTDVGYFLSLPLDKKLIEEHKDEFVISYIGKFGGQHRGLETAIQAMPGILKTIPNAKLLLVGNGSIKPVLEKMVDDFELAQKVSFVDWQPFEKVPSYIALSAVCLVPHKSNPHTEATSPHKLFQYMLIGKPVVVSSCMPLRRVVEERRCGIVFEADDSDALKRAVIRLRSDRLRKELGGAGKKAVLERYNWGETSKKLLKVYEHLAQKNIS